MNQIAHERAEAARAVDQAVDLMQRAAVNLDAAITHAKRGDIPTPGTVTTLEAMIDVLRDQIDFGTREHRWLTDLAKGAEASTQAPAA